MAWKNYHPSMRTPLQNLAGEHNWILAQIKGQHSFHSNLAKGRGWWKLFKPNRAITNTAYEIELKLDNLELAITREWKRQRDKMEGGF